MTNQSKTPGAMVPVPREVLRRVTLGDASMGASATQLLDAWQAMGELRAILAAPADHIEDARAMVEQTPAVSGEPEAALLWLDDFVARCNGDDRGSCLAVNTLRAHIAPMRAEIDRLRRAESNDAIAYKAAIEKQEELRARIAELEVVKLSMHRELHALVPEGYTNPDAPVRCDLVPAPPVPEKRYTRETVNLLGYNDTFYRNKDAD